VTNAVQYGRPPITVRLERKSAYWLLEVSDGGMQRASRTSRFRKPGWGLRIVDALADSWGTGEDGSRVWCRLPDDS
jgi:two-component sensor histidine kinase